MRSPGHMCGVFASMLNMSSVSTASPSVFACVYVRLVVNSCNDLLGIKKFYCNRLESHRVFYIRIL